MCWEIDCLCKSLCVFLLNTQHMISHKMCDFTYIFHTIVIQKYKILNYWSDSLYVLKWVANHNKQNTNCKIHNTKYWITGVIVCVCYWTAVLHCGSRINLSFQIQTIPDGGILKTNICKHLLKHIKHLWFSPLRMKQYLISIHIKYL